jgi:chromosome segregation ATPase
MAETEIDTSDPRQVASITLAQLRRIENQLGKMMEVLLRHDTRLGRVERDIGELKRDVGELKGDMVLLENRLLTATSEILRIVERIDEHQQRLDTIAARP